MQRIAAIKKPDLGKVTGGLLKKKKKKGVSLNDSDDDYEFEQHGDAASGNTAEDSFADFDSAPANQARPVRRTSLAGKIVNEWKKKKADGKTADDGGISTIGNAFEDDDMDDMSMNFGNDDISVDATYLEGGLEQPGPMLSPMSALRKGQKTTKKTKQVKKALEQMQTLDEGSSDDDDDDDDASSKGAATGDESSSGGGDDEYDSFFAYLDKEKKTDDPKDEKPAEEPVESESAKKPKKKKKKKNKEEEGEDLSKKKKKKKKVKKKKADDDDDDAPITTSDLLGLVSPDSPKSPKKLDAEEVKSKPIPPPPDLSLDQPKDEPKNDEGKKVDHHAARRALARLSKPVDQGMGALSLDAKMGDSRVDRAARRAIRRSSIGAVGAGAAPPVLDSKSRFDQIVGGQVADRPRFRRKSMDMDIRLTPEESEQLKSRVQNARPAPSGARYRRKSMDTRMSIEESEELRKRIDRSLTSAMND